MGTFIANLVSLEFISAEIGAFVQTEIANSTLLLIQPGYTYFANIDMPFLTVFIVKV